MGTVIKHTSEILKLVSINEPCSLHFLTSETGMKKPTLYLTLKSLVEVGFLSKDNNNLYSIGPAIFDLTAKKEQKAEIRILIGETARRLRDATGETVVASGIEQGFYEKILGLNSNQTIIVNESVFSKETFYTSATGRTMLAFASSKERNDIIMEIGLPKDEEWMEIDNLEKLHSSLDEIRKSGHAEVENSTGQVVFLAVPVLPEKRIFALGLSVPKLRCAEKRKEELLMKMSQAAKELEKELQVIL